MTFNSVSSNDCYGLVEGNDDTTLINAITDANGINWQDTTNPWLFAARDNIGGADTSNQLFGWLTFELATNTTGTPDTWTLNWTDNDSTAAPNLPVTIDFIGVLKGSPGYAAYLFLNKTLVETDPPAGAGSGQGTGTFQISFLNPGGNIPDLSHLSIYARLTEGSTGQTQIPEPNMLALLGIGLLGFAGTSLRRRKVRKG